MKWVDTQTKYDPAKSSTEYHFNRTPRLPSQHIEVARECDTREQVGEEDIDGRSYYELVE